MECGGNLTRHFSILMSIETGKGLHLDSRKRQYMNSECLACVGIYNLHLEGRTMDIAVCSLEKQCGKHIISRILLRWKTVVFFLGGWEAGRERSSWNRWVVLCVKGKSYGKEVGYTGVAESTVLLCSSHTESGLQRKRKILCYSVPVIISLSIFFLFCE